jgi:hypothetical protein
MTTSRLKWNASDFMERNNNVNKRFDITKRDEAQRMWGRTEKTMASQNHLWLDQRSSPKVHGVRRTGPILMQAFSIWGKS